MNSYFEPLIPNLEEFVKKYGDDGKGELNSVASAHKVVVAVDDTENHRYCGSDIKDGALRLLFHVEQFGQYPSDASTDIIGALKAAPAPKGAFSLITRNGIKTDYEANVEEVRAALAEIVAVPELKLTPNFEFNHGVLSEMGTQAPSNWETKLGYATLEYFKGVKESLKKQKFDSDDMLQEGFQESISKNEITLRIVEPLDCGGSYNEVVIKDGVLIVQVSLYALCPLSRYLRECRLYQVSGEVGQAKLPTS
jgi:hypothetical protein